MGHLVTLAAPVTDLTVLICPVAQDDLLTPQGLINYCTKHSKLIYS